MRQLTFSTWWHAALSNTQKSVIFSFIAVVLTVLYSVRLWRKPRSEDAEDASFLSKGPNLQALPANSATRVRLQAARDMYEDGKAFLLDGDFQSGATLIGQALELDELGCAFWSDLLDDLTRFQGVFGCTSPSRMAKFYRQLVEAWFGIEAYTLRAHYRRHQGEPVEELAVVRSRCDGCVALDPTNPAAYKLRADWLLRFGDLAPQDDCINDYHLAIRLIEADPEGVNVHAHGIDLQDQRRFLLASCHHSLGRLLRRHAGLPRQLSLSLAARAAVRGAGNAPTQVWQRSSAAASAVPAAVAEEEGGSLPDSPRALTRRVIARATVYEHFRLAAEHATSDFIHLADVYFELARLEALAMKQGGGGMGGGAGGADSGPVVAAFVAAYSRGLAADAQLQRWLPQYSPSSKAAARQLLDEFVQRGLVGGPGTA